MNTEKLAEKIAKDYGLTRGQALQIIVLVSEEFFKALGITDEMMADPKKRFDPIMDAIAKHFPT